MTWPDLWKIKLHVSSLARSKVSLYHIRFRLLKDSNVSTRDSQALMNGQVLNRIECVLNIQWSMWGRRTVNKTHIRIAFSLHSLVSKARMHGRGWRFIFITYSKDARILESNKINSNLLIRLTLNALPKTFQAPPSFPPHISMQSDGPCL